MENPSAVSLLLFCSFSLPLWPLGCVQRGRGCSPCVDRSQASCVAALSCLSAHCVLSLNCFMLGCVWDFLGLPRFHDRNDVKGKWLLVWPHSCPAYCGARQESTRRNLDTWSQTCHCRIGPMGAEAPSPAALETDSRVWLSIGRLAHGSQYLIR